MSLPSWTTVPVQIPNRCICALFFSLLLSSLAFCLLLFFVSSSSRLLFFSSVQAKQVGVDTRFVAWSQTIPSILSVGYLFESRGKGHGRSASSVGRSAIQGSGSLLTEHDYLDSWGQTGAHVPACKHVILELVQRRGRGEVGIRLQNRTMVAFYWAVGER